MGKIIEFRHLQRKEISPRRLHLGEINTVSYLQYVDMLICRFTAYDGYTLDFAIGEKNGSSHFSSRKLLELVNYFDSFGLEKEHYFETMLYSDRHLSELDVFGIINAFEEEVKLKQILLKYGITTNLSDVVISNERLGDFFLHELITDYRGRLRKYVGTACAKELIDFYELHKKRFHERCNIDTGVVLMN
jgi:hypothetical protein